MMAAARLSVIRSTATVSRADVETRSVATHMGAVATESANSATSSSYSAGNMDI